MSTPKSGVPVALTTMLTERLGLRHPIIQAPLAAYKDAILSAHENAVRARDREPVHD